MNQQGKVLATRPEDLGSVPETHKVQGESKVLQVVPDLRVGAVTRTHTHMRVCK